MGNLLDHDYQQLNQLCLQQFRPSAVAPASPVCALHTLNSMYSSWFVWTNG